MERNTLMAKCYPRIKDYCREKHGLEFQGICDNLLTCTVRAWDLPKTLIYCPAMNTRMWEHPITSKQLSTLKEWGYIEIPPISKKLMCGDTGLGGMAEVNTIVQNIKLISDTKYNK